MINLINKLLFLLNLPLITYYSPYSKEERNKIYREASRLLKQHNYEGLCYCIRDAKNEVFLIKLINFPELYIFKPFINWNSEYWFEPYLKEPRIKALEKAIKLTE